MKYLKIFEDFDQYDFVIQAGDDLQNEFDEISSHCIQFDENDFYQILNTIDSVDGVELGTNFESNSKILTFNINKVDIYIIHYFGDYCFSLSQQDWSHGYITSITTIDGLDALITCIKNKLNI